MVSFMCEVTVTVELNEKKYQTNVIANKEMSDETLTWEGDDQSTTYVRKECLGVKPNDLHSGQLLRA